MHSKIELTLMEHIATLKNTNLNTVIIEGKGDVVVYRDFPNRASGLSFDILPVGGRNNVLEIFKRKKEIIEKNKNNIKLVFVVDQDLWVIKGVPANYQDKSIVTTDGYSIENDIIRDHSLFKMVASCNGAAFNSDLNKLIYWYSLASSRESDYKLHVNHVLSNYKSLIELNPSEAYPEHLRNKIESDFEKYLRGKLLLSLLLNHKSKDVHLNSNAILTLGGCSPGVLVKRIEQKIHDALA